jgi:hypothetical protein
MINPKGKKVGVFGIQGSGKTWFVEKALIKAFRKPFVYLLHPEDFTSCGNNVSVYVPYKLVKGKKIIDRSTAHLDRVMGKFIEQAKLGKYDAFVLDEASTFLPKNLATLQKEAPNIIDAIDSHRHYGKTKGNGFSIVYMARRPQSLPTELVETSHFLFVFALEGKNAKEHLRSIHSDFKDQLDELSSDKHNFILKELGKAPQVYQAIKQKEATKNDTKKR